jgi:uroporphyrin-III C-methyltransferase
MGAGGLPQISQGLIAAGLDSGTPAAVIELGTTPSQRQVIGTVETIESLARDAHIGAPATIVIGAVVRLAEQLSGVMV